jgi:hypothetical protein
MMHRRRLRAVLSVLVSVTALGASAPSALADSGSISGTVTSAASGAALPGADVTLLNGTGQVAQTKTDAGGNYTFSGVGPDPHYAVYFSDSPYYDAQYYNGKSSVQSADFVAVSSGQATSGIDAAMQLGSRFTITGTVTDATTHTADANERVNLLTRGGTELASATTDANGFYALPAQPGSYVIEFANESGRVAHYWAQYYNDKGSLSAADPVTVTAGQVTSNVNAAVLPAGSISGTVRAASTGASAAGILIDVTDAGGSYAGETYTDSSGHYSVPVGGVGTSGSYSLRFVDPSGRLAMQYSGGAPTPSSASRVTVTASRTTTAVNALLQPAGRISGTVADAVTHARLNNIYVNVLYPDGSQVPANGQTTPDGTYTVNGLTPGVPYKLLFSEVTGPGLVDHHYADGFYCQASSNSAALPVITEPGAVTSGINEAMWHKGTPAPACPQPTPAQISSVLTRALSASGPAAAINAILHSGGYPATVTSAGSGAAQLAWYYLPGGSHKGRATKPIVVASGSKRLTTAGSVVIELSLTSQGRALLKRSTRLSLTAVGTFAPQHGKTTSKRQLITIKR